MALVEPSFQPLTHTHWTMGITIESLRRSTPHSQILNDNLDPSNEYEGPSQSDGSVGEREVLVEDINEREVLVEDINERDVVEVDSQTAEEDLLQTPSSESLESSAEDMTALLLEFEQEHTRKVRIVLTLC